MTNHAKAQAGRTKNRRVGAYDHRAKAAKQRSEFAARLRRAREERHRLIETQQPDDAAFAVALYRAEKARATCAERSRLKLADIDDDLPF
jgi:hypothetical protein